MFDIKSFSVIIHPHLVSYEFAYETMNHLLKLFILKVGFDFDPLLINV